jgi:diadenylate cyclase
MKWLEEIWYVRDIIRPLLDIGITSVILYRLYINIARTSAVQILRIVIITGCIYAAAYILQLNTLLWILDHILIAVIFIIAIIYQPELRRAFTRTWSRGGRLFRFGSQTSQEQIETIINALVVLSSKRRGALIVFPRKLGIRGIVDTGTRLNADLSSALILTLYDHNTPLHDGAAIVQSGKIVSAGCFLPLSEQADIRRSFGARHRAALGMAEDTDAVVLCVSEETGSISLAYNANLYYDLQPETAKRMIIALLNYHDVNPEMIEEVSHAKE